MESVFNLLSKENSCSLGQEELGGRLRPKTPRLDGLHVFESNRKNVVMYTVLLCKRGRRLQDIESNTIRDLDMIAHTLRSLM